MAVTTRNEMTRDHCLMAVIKWYKARLDEGEDLDDESTGKLADNEEDVESLTEGLIRLPKLMDPSIWSVRTLVSLYYSVYPMSLTC
jgi:hypothetical protein